jgi:predicted enzyme related to lactoylglutathione lyase
MPDERNTQQLYVSVENADASALRARELGGMVLREPLDFVNAGRVVALRDPSGGIVSLWQPRAHAGAELMNDVGALSWHELVTSDVDRAKSFYGKLIGWQYEDDSSGDTTITSAGSRIGTMRKVGDRAGVTASCWIPYFGVESGPGHRAQSRTRRWTDPHRIRGRADRTHGAARRPAARDVRGPRADRRSAGRAIHANKEEGMNDVRQERHPTR